MLIKRSKLNNLTPSLGVIAQLRKKNVHFIIRSYVVKCKKKIVLELKDEKCSF